MLAETEQDFVSTVKFAAKYNLRLVVKATGHDWYVVATLHPAFTDQNVLGGIR